MNTTQGFPCPQCGGHASPVWARYATTATVDGEEGSVIMRLPSHRCENGHLSGWRANTDYLADLAMDVDKTDYDGLDAGTVLPRRRLFRQPLCGSCGEKLVIVPSGGLLRGVLRRKVRASPDPVEFDMTIPAAACAVCGARPAVTDRAVALGIGDIETWLFEFLASLGPEDSVEVTSRDG